VTSERRLHRIVALAAVAVLFGVTSTVSALASGTEQEPVRTAAPAATAGEAPRPAAEGSLRVAPSAVRVARQAPKPATTTTATATHAPAAKHAARATPRRTSAGHAAKPVARHLTISSYVDAPGSQSAIDKCRLVLWTHAPFWLAGHNWCGYQWLAYVATGTTVTVTSGAAAGTYVVTGHLHLGRQGGALPHVDADLVLQTCIGSGTGLTLLRRV
jgi:hypothetical protein